MNNIFYLIFPAILLLAVFSEAQTIDRLDERNGFKDLILGSKVGDYPHLSFSREYQNQEAVPSGKIFAALQGHYLDIGTVPIDDVEVTVYDDYLLGISVKTPKDPNLLKGLRRAYGKPTQTLGTTSFVWKTDKLSLVYRSFSKSKLELYYNSIPVRDRIKRDKSQKVQDIADDF